MIYVQTNDNTIVLYRALLDTGSKALFIKKKNLPKNFVLPVRQYISKTVKKIFIYCCRALRNLPFNTPVARILEKRLKKNNITELKSVNHLK